MRQAAKETQQIKAFSLAAVLMEGATDLGDELTAAKTTPGEGEGKKKKKEKRLE